MQILFKKSNWFSYKKPVSAHRVSSRNLSSCRTFVHVSENMVKSCSYDNIS